MKKTFLAAGLLLVSCLFLFVGCSSDNSKKTLRIAATSVPHAQILEQVRQEMAKEGIDLKIVVIDDFNTPNRALADKEVDANYFQHKPFLDMQIQEFGYPLEKLVAVHIEPMGLYSHKIKDLNQLKEGDIIAIPSDPSNGARALFLLEDFDLIHLNSHDTKTSVHNIADNPKNFRFVEVDSPLLARSLDDVTLAAITTNFALQAGLHPSKDALALENEESPYVNIVVIRAGDEFREEIQALRMAITSERIRKYIESHYQDAIVPVF